MRAWLQMLHPEDVLSHAHVTAALCRTGIEYTRRTAPADGPGIVFFNDVTPAVYAILREATDNCRERVIAVATSREAAATHAWTILQAGASDLLVWRSDATAGSIFERLERWQWIDDLVSAPIVRDQLVGRSAPWLAVVRQIVESAVTSDLPVLLTGESGTGKERAARVVHALGSRASARPLVLLDCTTVVPELAGSEFFGHERGAFTGAVTARDGAFALANGSTLFLDEVGELPVTLQAELLRVVQEHTYKRVGSNQWQLTDFRLVCATNRNLLEEQAQGRFRRDLFLSPRRLVRVSCHRCESGEKTSSRSSSIS